MTRAQHQVTDDVVIEETHQAGVFRRRRIGLVERWADVGTNTEQELTAAQAFRVIFDRAQLREWYAVSSPLIGRVDGAVHGLTRPVPRCMKRVSGSWKR